MTATLAHLIGGDLVAAPPDDPILDPSSGSEIGRGPSDCGPETLRAVDAAGAAAAGWSLSTPAERASTLLALADAIADRQEEFATTESHDAGKPIRAAREELLDVLDCLRFFAGAARCLPGVPANEYRADHTSMLRREPLGVVGLLTPWNYPLMTACWKLGAALAAGNAVVLKPSELAPMGTALLAEVAREVFPAGVVNVVFGRGDTAGRALVGHPDVAMVSLTGGTSTGRDVARAAAGSLQRLSLELGGNAPVIVLADAELEAAAEAIALAAFANAGQDCTAAARVIAESAIAGELVERLEAHARRLRLGPALEEETDLGPLVSARQRDRVLALLDGGLGRGRILAGGRPPAQDGFFLEPTVVDRIDGDAALVREEVFGPVVTVQAVADASAAVVEANSAPQALASSVWTQDAELALGTARALRCGVVWINDHMVFASEMPHGGQRESGFGADLSIEAVTGFTTPKHVMVRVASPTRSRRAQAESRKERSE